MAADIDDFAGNCDLANAPVRETMGVRWESHLHGEVFPIREARNAHVTPIKVASELKCMKIHHSTGSC